jgi:chromatin segregation and condensation protein Rec8/ScpA/Scc1 (kleisin family)
VSSTVRTVAALSFLHLLKLEKRREVTSAQAHMWDDITITVADTDGQVSLLTFYLTLSVLLGAMMRTH